MDFFKAHADLITLALGAIVVTPLVWKRRQSFQLNRLWKVILATFIIQFSDGLVCMAFGSFEQALFNSDRKIALYGLFLVCTFLFIGVSKLTKRNWKAVLDTIAICIPPGLFLFRIGCLVNHCCDGVRIPGTNFYWPTTPAELIFFAAMFILLLWREKKNPPQGTQYFLLMAAYGAFRFVIEFVRKTPWSSLLHPGHLWSVIALIVGLGFYLELNRPSKKERRSSKC